MSETVGGEKKKSHHRGVRGGGRYVSRIRGFSNDYWDCMCEDVYIHPNSELMCSRCGESKRTSPRSLLSEVKVMLAAEKQAAKAEEKRLAEEANAKNGKGKKPAGKKQETREE